MSAFLIRRILMVVPVAVLMSMISFGMFYVLPGDAAAAILGAGERVVDQEQYRRLREDLGLNRPLPVQYVAWLSDALRGDLGQSPRTHRGVAETVWQRVPITLELTLLSMVLATAIGVSAGVVAAVRAGSLTDQAGTFLSLAWVAMPSFWFGILLIYAFAIHLKLLPAAGYVRLSQDPIDNLRHMVLPALVIAPPAAAMIMRHTRGALLEVLHNDYVLTAHAKGLAPRRVVGSHALRNAMLPVLTILGLQTGDIFGGAVIAESIFAVPGVGGLLLDSIHFRDFPVMQALVLMVALVVLAINLLTDVLYGVLDPRIRYR